MNTRYRCSTARSSQRTPGGFKFTWCSTMSNTSHRFPTSKTCIRRPLSTRMNGKMGRQTFGHVGPMFLGYLVSPAALSSLSTWESLGGFVIPTLAEEPFSHYTLVCAFLCITQIGHAVGLWMLWSKTGVADVSGLGDRMGDNGVLRVHHRLSHASAIFHKVKSP